MERGAGIATRLELRHKVTTSFSRRYDEPPLKTAKDHPHPPVREFLRVTSARVSCQGANARTLDRKHTRVRNVFFRPRGPQARAALFVWRVETTPDRRTDRPLSTSLALPPGRTAPIDGQLMDYTRFVYVCDGPCVPPLPPPPPGCAGAARSRAPLTIHVRFHFQSATAVHPTRVRPRLRVTSQRYSLPYRSKYSLLPHAPPAPRHPKKRLAHAERAWAGLLNV